MARKRASMREGPLAELFRATEAAKRGESDDQPADEPLPPAASADEQQTLILESSGAPTDDPAAAERRRREEAALEETVEHVPDLPSYRSSREEAALLETVEHVHDFEEPEAPELPAAASAPPVVEPGPGPTTRRAGVVQLYCGGGTVTRGRGVSVPRAARWLDSETHRRRASSSRAPGGGPASLHCRQRLVLGRGRPEGGPRPRPVR